MIVGKRYIFVLFCIVDKKCVGIDFVLKIIVLFWRLGDWIYVKGCSYWNKLIDICW